MNFNDSLRRFLVARKMLLGAALVVAFVAGPSLVSASSSPSTTVEMHPMEDPTSWKGHLIRQSKSASDEKRVPQQTTSGFQQARRALTEAASGAGAASGAAKHKPPKVEDDDDDDDDDDDWELPFTVTHKKPKLHYPFAGGDKTHGMMIDAGSQGTRLHVYEWDKRFLLDEEDLVEQSKGKLLSYPTSNNRWTDKYTPGLDEFAKLEDQPDRLEEEVGNYLGALLDFARDVLRDKKDEWHTYPIYLKATGGLRTLPQPQRIVLINTVRKLFHNKTFCPFSFEDERARVISGEEEAIYGWVGVNFAKGVLIDDSKGTGVGLDPSLTYGMIEMGGASTQIANFENNGDLMANLFKLQLGGSRHWNVYVHSYLYFGINGAWSRLNGYLHWEGKNSNPCLPLGSSVEFNSWMHMNDDAQFYPRSHPNSTPYSVTMVNNGTSFDYEDCSQHANDLLRKRTNQDWCDFQMDSNCGFAGIYQPPMPKVKSDSDKFIATSNFKDVYDFLKLKKKSYVRQIGKAAEKVCNLPWKELQDYNSKLEKPVRDDLVLAQMCFRSVFVYQLLLNGWEFGDDYKMTASDVINGQKLGWALGCMLYEINTLPWTFHPELLYKGPNKFLVALYIVLGTLVGAVAGLMFAMRFNRTCNRKVRESQFYTSHRDLFKNDAVRKSFSLDELDDLYADFDPPNGQFSNERMSLLS